MPGAPGTHVAIAAAGVTTFVAGGEVRYDLSQLASLAGPPPRKTYLRQLNVNGVVNATENSGAGNRTVAFQQLFTMFTSIILQMQGHQFYNLGNQGGASVRSLNFIMFGKQPQLSGTTWTWNSSQSTPTAGYDPEVSFVFPFYDPRGISPEDGILPVGILVGAYLSLKWNVALFLGANLTINTGATGTRIRACTAELIQRDEVRFPALSTWEEYQTPNKQGPIIPLGNLFTDVHLEAATATGLTAAAFTAANLTNVTYTSQGGLKTQDNLNPSDLINLYNAQQGLSSEGMVKQWSSGTADLVPIQYLPRSSKKITHIQPDLSSPFLQLTGAINPATPDYYALLHYIKPSAGRTIADLASKANQALPAGFAKNPDAYAPAKGAAKQAVAKSKSWFLPKKIQANPTTEN